MHCPKCTQRMEVLPDLYGNSGKAWYGCKGCDKVFEHSRNFASPGFSVKPFLNSIKMFQQMLIAI